MRGGVGLIGQKGFIRRTAGAPGEVGTGGGGFANQEALKRTIAGDPLGRRGESKSQNFLSRLPPLSSEATGTGQTKEAMLSNSDNTKLPG